jgi:uncharacterized Zn-binding protein involved in type VI secretion
MAFAARGTGGSTDVFINDLPAYRQGDKYSGDETILRGSTTVFINDKPAARLGDPTDEGSIENASQDVDTGP